MEVTIKDILNKEPFKGQQLIAGNGGLKNKVKYISVLETEPEQNNEVLRRTEVVYLTSLYYQRNSAEEMLKYLEMIKGLQSSGLCVIDDYINTFPPEVLDFCDANDIPLILVKHNIPYADMISSVMELIILSQQEKITENRLNVLESGNLSASDARQAIRELNPHFQSRITAFYISSSHPLSMQEDGAKELIQSVTSNSSYFAGLYKKGILIICSYSDSSSLRYEKTVNSIIHTIRQAFPNATIGISKDLLLDECGNAIAQAVACVQIYRTTSLPRCIRYDDLGLFKLLASFLGSKELESFYEETILTIIKYDDQYNTELFQSVRCFLKNNCNYSITSRELSVHENTVRYRIARIKELLNFHGSDMELFHTLDVAHKIYILKSNFE